MAIYPNHKLSSLYLYHWYVYNGEALAFKYCQGTKQLSYTAGLLRTIPIYIPGIIKEQTRIANVLSDTDALITKIEQLIAKKQTIKSATMQQLMTGRTRLPQFAKHSNSTLKGYKSSELGLIPEDWDVYTFNDLIESCSSGATPYRGNKSFYTG
ncbi:restriction endonuclease subunit S, partial [Enterobacter quasihormaechei]